MLQLCFQDATFARLRPPHASSPRPVNVRKQPSGLLWDFPGSCRATWGEPRPQAHRGLRLSGSFLRSGTSSVQLISTCVKTSLIYLRESRSGAGGSRGRKRAAPAEAHVGLDLATLRSGPSPDGVRRRTTRPPGSPRLLFLDDTVNGSSPNFILQSSLLACPFPCCLEPSGAAVFVLAGPCRAAGARAGVLGLFLT